VKKARFAKSFWGDIKFIEDYSSTENYCCICCGREVESDEHGEYFLHKNDTNCGNKVKDQLSYIRELIKWFSQNSKKIHLDNVRCPQCYNFNVEDLLNNLVDFNVITVYKKNKNGTKPDLSFKNNEDLTLCLDLYHDEKYFLDLEDLYSINNIPFSEVYLDQALEEFDNWDGESDIILESRKTSLLSKKTCSKCKDLEEKFDEEDKEEKSNDPLVDIAKYMKSETDGVSIQYKGFKVYTNENRFIVSQGKKKFFIGANSLNQKDKEIIDENMRLMDNLIDLLDTSKEENIIFHIEKSSLIKNKADIFNIKDEKIYQITGNIEYEGKSFPFLYKPFDSDYLEVKKSDNNNFYQRIYLKKPQHFVDNFKIIWSNYLKL